MKCKKIEQGLCFKPLKLEIEIESLDELKELWCRLNLSTEIIKKENFGNHFEVDYESKNDFTIYDVLDLELAKFRK